MKNTNTSKSSISLVRCSEWIRHASLALFVGSASLAAGMISSPFTGHADCGPGATALEKLNCAAAPSYGPNAQEDPTVIISNLINVFLGILGILFTLLFLYGGFLWMTARGDSKQVDKAKNLIQEAVIGLVIILSAWAVAVFVITNLTKTASGVAQ